MSTSSEDVQKLTFRRFEDGDHEWRSYQDDIFNEDGSHKCPVYVHRTPPCQAGCPSGEDVRGWLQVLRGVDKPPEGMSREEYAFRRLTEANPFPAIMGRVCPAPCEDRCNRGVVEDFVGINAVEQYIGDTAYRENYRLEVSTPLNDKRVAIVGAGPAGLSAAYQLRRRGYRSVIMERQPKAGGMFQYGLPGYRTPREVVNHEVQRVLELDGIELLTDTAVGIDVTLEQLESDYDAVIWTIGCQAARGLPLPGWDQAPNCMTGLAFLEAFNKGEMDATAPKVVCVGGGDTSVDVVSVARRLGHIKGADPAGRTGNGIGGATAAAGAAERRESEVILTALFTREEMVASDHEISDALTEGVTMLNGVMPIALLIDDTGKARGLKMSRCDVDDKGIPSPIEGTEFELEADLIVSAIGQDGELTGIEAIGNERRLIDADGLFQVPNRAGHFVAGDIVNPHWLTTAIGQASIAVAGVDAYLSGSGPEKRPKVDVHHFKLLKKLAETGLAPGEYDHTQARGTDRGNFALHNFEDRAKHEVVSPDRLFLGHFKYTKRNQRDIHIPPAGEVLGHFEERHSGLTEEQVSAEVNRCMSCGLCFECDNCVIYCPQTAISRVRKGKATMGRYVVTDYARCIGCHICADVCPTGYIDMGLG